MSSGRYHNKPYDYGKDKVKTKKSVENCDKESVGAIETINMSLKPLPVIN